MPELAPPPEPVFDVAELPAELDTPALLFAFDEPPVPFPEPPCPPPPVAYVTDEPVIDEAVPFPPAPPLPPAASTHYCEAPTPHTR